MSPILTAFMNIWPEMFKAVEKVESYFTCCASPQGSWGKFLMVVMRKAEWANWCLGNIMKCFSNRRTGLFPGQSWRRPKAAGRVRACHQEGTMLGRQRVRKVVSGRIVSSWCDYLLGVCVLYRMHISTILCMYWLLSWVFSILLLGTPKSI